MDSGCEKRKEIVCSFKETWDQKQKNRGDDTGARYRVEGDSIIGEICFPVQHERNFHFAGESGSPDTHRSYGSVCIL